MNVKPVFKLPITLFSSAPVPPLQSADMTQGTAHWIRNYVNGLPCAQTSRQLLSGKMLTKLVEAAITTKGDELAAALGEPEKFVIRQMRWDYEALIYDCKKFPDMTFANVLHLVEPSCIKTQTRLQAEFLDELSLQSEEHFKGRTKDDLLNYVKYLKRRLESQELDGLHMGTVLLVLSNILAKADKPPKDALLSAVVNFPLGKPLSNAFRLNEDDSYAGIKAVLKRFFDFANIIPIVSNMKFDPMALPNELVVDTKIKHFLKKFPLTTPYKEFSDLIPSTVQSLKTQLNFLSKVKIPAIQEYVEGISARLRMEAPHLLQQDELL